MGWQLYGASVQAGARACVNAVRTVWWVDERRRQLPRQSHQRLALRGASRLGGAERQRALWRVQQCVAHHLTLSRTCIPWL